MDSFRIGLFFTLVFGVIQTRGGISRIFVGVWTSSMNKPNYSPFPYRWTCVLFSGFQSYSNADNEHMTGKELISRLYKGVL